MLRKFEYYEMGAKIHNESPEITETIKNLRRRKGILRKDQRDLLNNYDNNLVNISLYNGFPPSSTYE